MKDNTMREYIKNVLANSPADWLNLTTHRLDIYNEELAKSQFLEQFEELFAENNSNASALSELPTAYDYIRLGHPLSCVLEWAIAKSNELDPVYVVSFSSQTIPVLAVLRKNLLEHKNTQISYVGELPDAFDPKVLREVYGYEFELNEVESDAAISPFDGSTVFMSQQVADFSFALNANIDFVVNLYDQRGSVLLVNGEENKRYISEIQHVRRRETIAMTPVNTLAVLQSLATQTSIESADFDEESNKQKVLQTIKSVTGASTNAVVASSGLSMQYAIMMGLIDEAKENHPGKAIRIIVPTNCYGGTNDQARRVAACLADVEVVDLSVDGGSDMVQSIDVVLKQIALEDAVPYIIAEIPTNPRVEVPDLIKLEAVLSKPRMTKSGAVATDPVFVLDQTFCPNTQFLGKNEILSSTRVISYVSGSKFPSGGKCTAGYCVANDKAAGLMSKIDKHLVLCDNEATPLQMQILAKQLPSMVARIADAYRNTRDFVNFIEATLPTAKINFVSEELAQQGFTPSVFSLDLPTKGDTEEEREAYKRALNLKLINLMITEIPDESKYCVSYGQLKGCYWTIPATSTQGTTKEGDKDYIARVAISANMDLDRHKKVFRDFVDGI